MRLEDLPFQGKEQEGWEIRFMQGMLFKRIFFVQRRGRCGGARRRCDVTGKIEMTASDKTGIC